MSTLIEQQTAVPAGTWQADTVHSSVGFEVAYLGIATFSGEFSDFEATLADGGSPARRRSRASRSRTRTSRHTSWRPTSSTPSATRS